MTDILHFHYPATVVIGKTIWILIFFLLVALTSLTIGQMIIPDLRMPIQTPCDVSMSKSCAPSIFFLLLSIIAMFLIINTRPTFSTDEKGINVRFFLNTTFLPWNTVKGIGFRQRGSIQYWIIYSDRLPFFCRAYGFMFLNNRSGFLISKSIHNASKLMHIIQNNSNPPRPHRSPR